MSEEVRGSHRMSKEVLGSPRNAKEVLGSHKKSSFLLKSAYNPTEILIKSQSNAIKVIPISALEG